MKHADMSKERKRIHANKEDDSLVIKLKSYKLYDSDEEMQDVPITLKS